MSQAITLLLQQEFNCIPLIRLASSAKQMQEDVDLLKPDLIICPFLTRMVPASIYKSINTWIVHPGIIGDRGPASLDWALLQGKSHWGVTILQATEQWDGGDIWSTHEFPIPTATTKSQLYRHEVVNAGVQAVRQALVNYAQGVAPLSLECQLATAKGHWQDPMKQVHCAIQWETDTANQVASKIRARDGYPGVLDTICNLPMFLYGAHVEREQVFEGVAPKTLLAQRDQAVLIACAQNTAVWITHMKPQRKATKDAKSWCEIETPADRAAAVSQNPIKLPSTMVLPASIVNSLDESKISLYGQKSTWREMWYETRNHVAYVYIDCYNGALSTQQCRNLLALLRLVQFQQKFDLEYLVLVGGTNGIHLCTIEASKNPVQESWENINAINDVVLEIMKMKEIITISALSTNAGAGGVMLALASDFVVAPSSVILNPHYKTMQLYGSEYWTYNLPRKFKFLQNPTKQWEAAQKLTEECKAISAVQAWNMGLIDAIWGQDSYDFKQQMYALAQLSPDQILAKLTRSEEGKQMSMSIGSTGWSEFISLKQKQRGNDEWLQTVQECRKNELEFMRGNFIDPEYTRKRQYFVFKVPTLQTPQHLISYKPQTIL